MTWGAELVLLGLANLIFVFRIFYTESGWPKDEASWYQWVIRQPLWRLQGIVGLFYFGLFLVSLGAVLP